MATLAHRWRGYPTRSSHRSSLALEHSANRSSYFPTVRPSKLVSVGAIAVLRGHNTYAMNTEQLTTTPDRIGRRPANWKRFRLSMNKAEHLAERARCIDMRNQCRVAYVAAYTAAALTLGEGGPFTGIPGTPKVPEATMVSGGTWSHWPHPVKDAVAKYIRASHEWEDRALLHHRAAGLRTSTFRNTWGRSI